MKYTGQTALLTGGSYSSGLVRAGVLPARLTLVCRGLSLHGLALWSLSKDCGLHCRKEGGKLSATCNVLNRDKHGERLLQEEKQGAWTSMRRTFGKC
jgi:hypothetical protein